MGGTLHQQKQASLWTKALALTKKNDYETAF
jgi:hypothetical protein